MTAPTPADSPHLRLDIEGLRAVAVLLVLLYHSGSSWFRGGYVGVDVFLVVSGFLITGLILREIRTTDRFKLGAFYARRARRLLPATAACLAGVALLTWAFLPANRWGDIAGDIIASSTYVMNWRLAGRAVDYLAADDALSPVQHFWSLGVEEQFYLFWPILIVGLALGTARGRARSSTALLTGVAAIAILSLAWSIVLTFESPSRAYFVTTTRVWELAIGGALAVVVSRPRFGRTTWAAVRIGGLVAIVFSAVTYSSATRFPGWTALLPTLGTAAVISAGDYQRGSATHGLLSWRPLVGIGGLSYSLYLWHWPLIVIAAILWQPMTPEKGLVVIAASFIPAWLTKRYVEDPIRHNDRFVLPLRRAVALGAACTTLGIFVGVALWAANPSTTRTNLPVAASTASLPSDPAAVPPLTGIVPHPALAREDNPWDGKASSCHQDQDSAELKSCAYGNVDSDTRVALVGDSHAAQWLGALSDLALDRGWRLETYTKSACIFGDVTVKDGSGRLYTSCSEWNTNLIEQLIGKERPDIIITSTSRYRAVADGVELTPEESRIAVAQGLARSWSRLTSEGLPVIVIRDTPRPQLDIPECVLIHHPALEACVVDLVTALEGSVPQVEAMSLTDGVSMIDLTDLICPDGSCPPVMGNVLVWRDSHHLTGTFVDLLKPDLSERLDTVLQIGE